MIDPIGADSELVINGTFDSDTDWTKGDGWTTSGKCGIWEESVGYGNLEQDISIIEGQTYLVQYEVGSIEMYGQVKAQVGGTDGVLRTSAGVYREIITAGAGSALKFIPSASPTGFNSVIEIDNVSVCRIIETGKNWPLYVSSMPDGDGVKTNCGAVYDTAGILDGKLSSGEVVQHPGIQLRIRSSDYEVGYAKIEELALALDNVNQDTIVVKGNTYLLQNISRTTSVVPLGSERGYKRRFVFTVNFLITIRKI